MDFGKLLSIENVDFRLPPEPPQNGLLPASLPAGHKPAALYLGATGYNMKNWVGKWYPAGTKDKDFLRQYGLQFNTIEHNTTHYRIPDAATVARWREETPDDFRFCPKIPQTISHAADMGLSGRQISLFCNVIQDLGKKLGCCFLQLPPYFSVTHLMTLYRFLEQFPAEIPLAVEVRHPSFFEPTVAAESYFDLLRTQQRAAVITDVAGRRDVAHMRLTNGCTMVRFVGNRLHPTDYTRIQEWALRLADWTTRGLNEVYFFTHEPDNVLAPDLAAYCVESFKKQIPDALIRGPQEVVPPGGVQGSLF